MLLREIIAVYSENRTEENWDCVGEMLKLVVYIVTTLKCNHERTCVFGGGLCCCKGADYEISIGRNTCWCYLVQVL
jgi:hypothetical protein